MTDSMIAFDKRCQALLMCELRYNKVTRQWEGIYPWNNHIKLPVAILNDYQLSYLEFMDEQLPAYYLAMDHKPPSNYKYI